MPDTSESVEGGLAFAVGVGVRARRAEGSDGESGGESDGGSDEDGEGGMGEAVRRRMKERGGGKRGAGERGEIGGRRGEGMRVGSSGELDLRGQREEMHRIQVGQGTSVQSRSTAFL